MKRFLLHILSPLVLLMFSYEGWCLPPCSESKADVWNNCIGTYVDKFGNKYIGEWKNDNFDGQGTLTLTNGGKYIGYFENGRLHGKGTIIFANGDKYLGQLRFDQIYGKGTYKYGIEGRVKLGITENGTFPYEWEAAERIRNFAKKLKKFRTDTD